VDQSTQDVTATQLTKGRRTRRVITPRRRGRAQAKAAVWAALVVVFDVAAEHANQLAGAYDQQLVQALEADRPDPTFGDGVGVGCPNRRADDLDIG
jgi:hypothetical protein